MVRVAGSNPVVRSGRGATGGMAEWLGKGLQNPVPRFDSGCRLSVRDSLGPDGHRAISSGGERFLDAEEVSGSNPLSPTLKTPANTDNYNAADLETGGVVHQPCSNPVRVGGNLDISRHRGEIRRLVAEEHDEPTYCEFKRILSYATKKEKGELVKDVSSFANVDLEALGGYGYLVFGVSNDGGL
jgi:Putative DNA-binding domain